MFQLSRAHFDGIIMLSTGNRTNLQGLIIRGKRKGWCNTKYAGFFHVRHQLERSNDSESYGETSSVLDAENTDIRCIWLVP